MDDLIRAAADKHGIPFSLVKAIVQKESVGNPWACRYEPAFFDRYVKRARVEARPPCSKDTERSLRAHSFGLMQVMGQTARENGFEGVYLTELCDPATNLDVCCRYLRRLYERYDDWKDAIASYNAGSPRFVPGTKTYVNQAYVDGVLALQEGYG